MAGTLTISTLSDGTNSTSSTNCIQGSAKAWLAYNGSTSTILSSYNVSSVTKNSAGDYTVIYTNAFADANYSVVGMTLQTDGVAYLLYGYNNIPYTTTQCRVITSSTGALNDTKNLSLAIFR
jgi:hypothetical protein